MNLETIRACREIPTLRQAIADGLNPELQAAAEKAIKKLKALGFPDDPLYDTAILPDVVIDIPKPVFATEPHKAIERDVTGTTGRIYHDDPPAAPKLTITVNIPDALRAKFAVEAAPVVLPPRPITPVHVPVKKAKPEVPEGSGYCPNCKTIKVVAEFGTRRVLKKNGYEEILQSHCRLCRRQGVAKARARRRYDDGFETLDEL